MLKAALIVFVAGWLPLLAYTLFGPADGNPIGLGLLAWATTALAIVLAGLGLLWRAVRYVRG